VPAVVWHERGWGCGLPCCAPLKRCRQRWCVEGFNKKLTPGRGCVKCLFRATRRKVIPCGWMSNTYDYLPDCFDHQLWLVLVDVMAAVFGYEEACVRDECRQILVGRTQDRFQCIGRKPLRLLRQLERTHMGENCQWHWAKRATASKKQYLTRDAAATTWALADPSQIGIASDLLSHSNLRTTEKHYNRARGVVASRAYAKIIRAKRSDKQRYR